MEVTAYHNTELIFFLVNIYNHYLLILSVALLSLTTLLGSDV